MTNLPHTISGTISEIGESTATIMLENGETVTVPKRILSETVFVNSKVRLAVFSDVEMSAEHERLAKAVIEELLRKE